MVAGDCAERADSGARILGSLENAREVFFGLADVLAHHAGQIDAIKIQRQVIREYLGGHRFSRAADAGTARQLAFEAPLPMDAGPSGNLSGDFTQLLADVSSGTTISSQQLTGRIACASSARRDDV